MATQFFLIHLHFFLGIDYPLLKMYIYKEILRAESLFRLGRP